MDTLRMTATTLTIAALVLATRLPAADLRRWEVVLDDILAKSREPVAEATG